MALLKRKAGSEGPLSKVKRSRASSQTRKVSQKPTLEEPAFRRGGAEILTPLEQRQIRNQAFQDALFDDSTDLQPNSVKGLHNEGFPKKSSAELLPVQASRKRKRLRDAEEVGEPRKDVPPNSAPRIEGLSYKKLIPGFLVLGQVTEVGHYDVTLSLPNNLVGYIPLRFVSQRLNSDSHTLKATSPNSNGPSQPDKASRKLRDYVHPGQYLRAVVTPSINTAGLHSSHKKRIELSTLPRQVNASLTQESIPVNSMLQAEVISTEDHGLIMDVGLADPSVKGFVPSKELDPNIELSAIRPGTVMLCMVTSATSNGKVVKLSAAPRRSADFQKSLLPQHLPSVAILLPGAAIEFNPSNITPSGIAGKIMGLVDVTADFIHSGQLLNDSALNRGSSRHKNLRGRIIWVSADTDTRTIAVSLLPHILDLSQAGQTGSGSVHPPTVVPIGTVKEHMRVENVAPDFGLLMDVGVHNLRGFAHISRLCDERVRSISETSGQYKVGSLHRGRVVGYNAMDGLLMLSLEPKILDLPFLGLEDLQPGHKATATVEKLTLQPNGVSNVLVKLTDSIVGLIPEVHFADVPLQLPERRFKIGSRVNVRVLSVDLEKRRVRLTCKKTLLNGDFPVWETCSKLEVGMKSLGTVHSLTSSGAILEFFGPVKGFLPTSEMSDSFIPDPTQHFRVGQVLNVHILALDKALGRLTLTCRNRWNASEVNASLFEHTHIGEKVTGKIVEKLRNEIILELEDPPVKAVLPFGHLLDGSSEQCLSMAMRLRVGQSLQRIMVIGSHRNRNLLKVTSKPLLLEAFDSGRLPQSFQEVSNGADVVGFVKEITAAGVFVRFAGELTGLLPRSQLMGNATSLSDYGLEINTTVSSKVLSLDLKQQRFLLSQRKKSMREVPQSDGSSDVRDSRPLVNPVDGVSGSIEDFSIGKSTQARVTAVKETQLNVELADGVLGRVDVSQIFDSWEDIKDRKWPLGTFRTGQILQVRILGIHDSKNHRYLPVTHSRTTPVFELSALSGTRAEDGVQVPTLDQIPLGSRWLCFVNNVAKDHLWVNLTPNIRGRIHAFNVSNDPSVPCDLGRHFPTGSAIRATVFNVDLEKHWLDLTARERDYAKGGTLDDIEVGERLPAKILHVTDMVVKLRLRESIIGLLHRADVDDDFSRADIRSFKEGTVVTVCVLDIDRERGRVHVSTRPSRILNSKLAVEDQEIVSFPQLHVGNVVRGFVKNVTEHGVYVSLSHSLTAFVRVADLSDDFVKAWGERFKLGQLVKGRLVAIDETLGHIRLSLKKSVLLEGYRPRTTWADLEVGRILSGTVRKVEVFGVFVLFDNSENVSGLCHRSEMADEPVSDARLLYNEGDAVKAKILKIDRLSKRLSLGMKSSYFGDGTSSSALERAGSPEDMQSSMASWQRGDRGLQTLRPDEETAWDRESEEAEKSIVADSPLAAEHEHPGIGLQVEDFDWAAEGDRDNSRNDLAFLEPGLSVKGISRRGHKESTLPVDKTADLDSQSAQSVSSFERLLVSEPSSSFIWLNYISFHLRLGEVDKARDIAERAIGTLATHGRDAGSESFNVWVGFLNLEFTYGDQNSLDRLFKRACEYNDTKAVHKHLASIFIRSGAYEVSMSRSIILSIDANTIYRKPTTTWTLWYKNSPVIRKFGSITEPFCSMSCRLQLELGYYYREPCSPSQQCTMLA